MAEPRKQKDRTRDVEELAADLFIQMVIQHGASRSNVVIARDALTHARVFYETCDNPPVKE